MVAFRHSLVLLSGVVSRARGTRIVVAPNVPEARSYRSRPSTASGFGSNCSMKPRMRVPSPLPGIEPMVARKMSSFGGAVADFVLSLVMA